MDGYPHCKQKSKKALNYLLLNVRTSFHCELKVLTFTLMVNTSVCQYILFHTSTLWLAQLVRKIDNHERLNQVSFMRHFLLNKIKTFTVFYFEGQLPNPQAFQVLGLLY